MLIPRFAKAHQLTRTTKLHHNIDDTQETAVSLLLSYMEESDNGLRIDDEVDE